MRKVFEIEVIKDITGEVCINLLEMHPSWSMKAGTKLYATKWSETLTNIHIVSDKCTDSFQVPIAFAKEYFKILGEGKGAAAERLFRFVNQEENYN